MGNGTLAQYQRIPLLLTADHRKAQKPPQVFVQEQAGVPLTQSSNSIIKGKSRALAHSKRVSAKKLIKWLASNLLNGEEHTINYMPLRKMDQKQTYTFYDTTGRVGHKKKWPRLIPVTQHSGD